MSMHALLPLLAGRSDKGPAYRALADSLRLLILDGRLALGVALPGERDAASALQLSRTTVSAAYALLRDEGYLVSRAGARSITALPAASDAARPGPVVPDGILDLAYATLPAAPGTVHAAYASALEALPVHLPGHGYAPSGVLELRAAIAERYSARGLATTPDQVLVTSGAQHALSLLLRQFTSPGNRVLVDHPSYPHALDALADAGCRPVPVAFRGDRWDLEGIRVALRQSAPTLAYLIPDFHNPTGRCMDAEERVAVARAARDARTVLVVDETLVDLGLDGPPPPPVAVHNLDVIAVGSMSKSFWGGLRVGWIRASAEAVSRLTAARASVDLGSPVLEQLAAAALLRNAEDVLGPRREQLRVQRDALVSLLSEHLPDWRVEVPPGGLSLWVELPEPVSSALAATAPRHGLRLAAGPRFGIGGAFDRFLRIPFTLTEPDLRTAVVSLAAANAEVSATPGKFAASAAAIERLA